ncbi:hypothetical protein [Clostridium ljungdahlii]|uniref:Uncharacterized protein n=1 Tax=Clostridium ljungdahlii TaxID=1538 RepID=A0A166RBA6_9CLOT|nr:hypothetical protein [Clostridium ljungdahlii]OAA90660.1 hypothetical protein WY13_01564 [Clostridium ljungdahlii]
MKWEEVRKIYSNQFVKLQILEWHMEGNNKYIDNMAIIKAIKDNREATKELVRSKGDVLVYHTGNEDIVLEVRNIKGYRGII